YGPDAAGYAHVGVRANPSGSRIESDRVDPETVEVGFAARCHQQPLGCNGFSGRQRQGDPTPVLLRAHGFGAGPDLNTLALQDLRGSLPGFWLLERKQLAQRFHDGYRNSEACEDLAQLQANRPTTENYQ